MSGEASLSQNLNSHSLGDDAQADAASTAPAAPAGKGIPARLRTNTAEIDGTIIHPGSVKIDVRGAFIVEDDEDEPSPNGESTSHNRDIRLPNQTAVVSHIAVDVCAPSPRALLRSAG